MYTVKGEGFPQYKAPYDRGDLIIQFLIQDLPTELYEAYVKNTEGLKKVESILGERDDEIEHQDCEEVTVEDYNEELHTPHGPGLVDPWDEDDDGPRGGPSCHTT